MADRGVMPLSHLPKVHFAGQYDGRHPVPFHTHPGSELVAVTRGSCRIEAGGRSLLGLCGGVFVLPRGVPHNQLSIGHARTTYVVYQTTAMSFSDAARTIQLDPDDGAMGWLEDIRRLLTSASPPSETALGALLLAVIERLKALEHRDAVAKALPAPMVKAIGFIDRNLVDAIAVAQIADAAGVSTSHLTTLFRTRYGCGPLKYQQRLRMAMAAKLLANSYLSIGEVGAACGYDDANYFSRIFHAQHGLAPLRWRRRLETQPA